MDVDEAAERLYAALPEQFVAERNSLAAEAKAAGDKAGADAIRRLAKPSQPAWQVNLLVREHAGTAGELAEVASALRAAAEGGDPREVRRVNGERQALVSRLADEAGRLAEGAVLARAALDAAAAALSNAQAAAVSARARADQGAEEVSQLEARLRATRTRAASTALEVAEAEARATQALEEHERAQAAYDAARGD